MFCPHCGNQLPDGSKFCGKCGAQLGGAAPTPGPMTDGAVTVTPPKKGLGSRAKLGIIVVVALAVVGAIIFGVVSCVGGNAHASAQSVADSLDAAMSKMIDNDFSSEAITGAMNDLVDLMPEEAVNQELQEQGMTREDLTEQLQSSLGFADVEQIQDYMSMVDMTADTSVGDPLSADELDDINDGLGEYGLTATEGNRLVMSMEVSAMGQTQSQDVDTMCAVKIDGSWYLWGL